MSGKWHGVGGKKGNNSGRYGLALTSYNVPGAAASAAAVMIAKEAQRKIDERHAKKGVVDRRTMNSPYSEEFKNEVLRRHANGEKLAKVCRELGVNYTTATQWKDGTNRAGFSAAAAKKVRR